MTRRRDVRKWFGKLGVVGIVSAAMVMIPLFEHPAAAQQTWEPPPQQQWSQPPPGAPAYAPPPPFDSARAVQEATQDAQADNNGALWFFAGCLLGLIGVIIAAVADPSPPMARVMGKSPEYVTIYTSTYRSAGHTAQLHSAMWGCGVVLIVEIGLLIFLVHQTNTTSGTGTAFILRQ
jgi:hypothetical protein